MTDPASSSKGRIEALWIKRAHRGKMDSVPIAELIVGEGVAGSADRSRRRQVTIIASEAWDGFMNELRADTDPSARRANMMVSGLSLSDTRGRILKSGDVRLAVGGELTPCERMDEALPGLRAAMKPNWGGGVFAQVLNGGVLKVGDPIEWDS